MSKLLVVFGATGQQGGSVVSYVSKELGDQYRIRGVTRDPSKPEAQKLKEAGVEVVTGDANNKQSLLKALEGADAVFAMTSMKMDGTGDQFEEGKSIADAAVQSGVEYLIWSTLPPVNKISGGEMKHVEHFDKKAEVETYIRGLPIKSAFYSPGGFLQNFHNIMKPQPVQDGYSMVNVMNPKTTLPYIDVVADTGKYVGAILSSPEKYEGKTLYAASGLYSFEDISQIISKATNKKVTYTQIPVETFSSFLPPAVAADITEMFQLYDKYGCYGPESKALVESTLKDINFVPTTPEQFFQSNPLTLD